jgi:hypothetical protein
MRKMYSLGVLDGIFIPSDKPQIRLIISTGTDVMADEIPVGGSLLANASVLCLRYRTANRLREQPPSHRGRG